jgi:large subunit ribosomal protein L17
MRHSVRGRKLGRTASHRKALLRSLATSLFRHKRIRTTLAKAKETRSFAETLITKARKNDLHSKRQVMSEIHDKEVVKELFGDILEKIGDRAGGYTRVIKLGKRIGDAADIAILELVDFNEVMKAKDEEKKEQKEAKKVKKQKEDEEATPAVEDANVIEETKDEKNPKKRGRKKKEDVEEAEEKPKKRGRKKKEE